MNDEEKACIINQAKAYLSGQSLREIAKNVKCSHVTVRRNLVVKLKEASLPLYYEVVAKLNDNTPDSIENPEIKERMLVAYKLLVEENNTVLEIADILGTTEFVIYRDLTKRMKRLHEIAPDVVTEEMTIAIKETMERHSMENSPLLGTKK